jgi:predicted peroxiredoxin
MKNLLYFTLAAFFAVSCNSSANRSENDTSGTDTLAIKSNSNRDGVFIHITESYNDPHRVLMPLKMATLMADDKDVLVYMDIHAVEILAKGSEDIKFGDFESAHTYIKKLLDKNVGIYACPTCMQIAGITQPDLIDGVLLAQKDRFFDFTDGRILNLDY